MIFNQVKQASRVIYFDPPLALQLALDEETNTLWIAANHDLDIHVYAQTREQLADNLTAEIFFLWDEYAKETADNLTEKAKELQTKLLTRCRESSEPLLS